MPILSQPISELTIHVFDPVIRQISHRIIDMLNYREQIKNNIHILTDWSASSVSKNDKNEAKLDSESFRVNASIQMNPMSQKFDVYNFTHTSAYGVSYRTFIDKMPIYYDESNKVRLVEIPSPVTIVLNCELILRSTELAFRTPQMLFNGYENGSIHHFRDLAFDYPIPKPLVSALFGIWEIDRLKGKPVGRSFLEYLKIHTGGGWQTHKHRDREQYEIVNPVYNLQPLAVLEYSEDSPRGVMQDRLAVGYAIPFTYTIQFTVPSMIHMQYPSMICNTLLSEKYIPEDRQNRYNALPETIVYNAMEGYKQEYGPKFPMTLHMPHYDEWIVPKDAPVKSWKQYPILIAAIQIDEDQEYTTIDLKPELDPDFDLQPFVKEILTIQGPESAQFDTLYNVAIFREDKQFIPYQDFSISEDMVISFKPKDIASHYRLVISMATDLNFVNKKWWELIKKYYPYIHPGIQQQVIPLLPLDPFLGPYVVKPDGSIHDQRGDEVGKIEDMPIKGENYEPSFTSRIVEFAIRTYEASGIRSGNKR